MKESISTILNPTHAWQMYCAISYTICFLVRICFVCFQCDNNANVTLFLSMLQMAIPCFQNQVSWWTLVLYSVPPLPLPPFKSERFAACWLGFLFLSSFVSVSTLSGSDNNTKTKPATSPLLLPPPPPPPLPPPTSSVSISVCREIFTNRTACCNQKLHHWLY